MAILIRKHFMCGLRSPPCLRLLQSEVAHQLAQEKVLLQPCGKDGRPLLVIRVAKHHQIRDISEVERFVVYSLEAAATMCDLHPANPDMKMWALFDCEGVKWANMDAHALRSCFHLLNLAFPERVEKIFMLNSPMIFDALWRLVRPFIDPVSRSKVEFVHGKKGIANILETVDPAVVPVAYGGSTEEVDVGSAVRILREQREGGKAGNGTEAQQEDPAEEFFDAEGDCPDV